MKQDDFYLQLIVEYIEDIERYVRRDKGRFFDDDMVRNATLRQLQIMAESTKRLSDQTQQRKPEIPWKEIADFRNILVHNYDGRINLDVVWTTIERELPVLKAAAKELLEE